MRWFLKDLEVRLTYSSLGQYLLSLNISSHRHSFVFGNQRRWFNEVLESMCYHVIWFVTLSIGEIAKSHQPKSVSNIKKVKAYVIKTFRWKICKYIYFPFIVFSPHYRSSATTALIPIQRKVIRSVLIQNASEIWFWLYNHTELD